MNGTTALTRFLSALATRGGAILILIVMTFFVDGGSFILYLRHDMSAHDLGSIITNGGLISALMLALKISSESTATTTTTPDGKTTSVASSGESGASVTTPAVPPVVPPKV